MMKINTIAALFLFAFQSISAQNSIPSVHSNTDETYFIEGDTDVKSNWWLDPSLDLDVYETNKISGPTSITFYTDIESKTFNLKPGEHADFNVILNGKDTCKTRISAPAIITKYVQQVPASHDTVPFSLTSGNNIKIQAILNESDTLDLFFDTGATSLVMTHKSIKERSSLLADLGENYKTRDYHPLPFKNTLRIGNESWSGLTIYPVSITGQETDGHFGWNLFDGRLIEINYDQMIFVIHSSLETIPPQYSASEMEYINTLFCIDGVLTAGGKEFRNRYLFDTGYQKSILLDSVLMQEQQFPRDLPLIKVDSLRNGEGKVFITKNINSDQLNLGGATARNIPTQLLNTANPAQFKTHILGNDLLKRFNLIVDFQNNIVYLAKNAVDYQASVEPDNRGSKDQ